MATLIGLIDFVGYPLVQPTPAPVKPGHGKAVGGRRYLAVIHDMLQEQMEQRLARRVAREHVVEMLLAERLRQEEAEVIHQQHEAARAAWTVLIAEL